MANKNLLTNSLKVSQVDQAYYGPVSVVSGSTNVISATYCFISRVDPWTDDNSPTTPVDTPSYMKSVYKNMIAAKKINSSDISPVIQRNDWMANTVYDYYSDTTNMSAKDANGFNVYNFYINNSYNQVFKCLWNNNGGVSTHEPFFQPGTYGTNNIYSGTDGYKWKYIYTIDTGSQIKFMDADWIPISVGNDTSDTSNPLLSSAGCGDIEVINVVNGGSGYDPTKPITVAFSGYDGTGAAGIVQMSGNTITDVIVTNPGMNYTTANVSIVSAYGSGATVIAPISPVGGHGNDPIEELGCCNIMYTCTFNGSEGGYIPTDIDYRQIGLVINPVDTKSTPATGTDSIYKIYTEFTLAQGAGSFMMDEIIYQGPIDNPTFTATMLDFSTSTNILSLINITGTPILNTPVTGATSGCVRTLLNINIPYFIPQSGYITYIENRTGVQRSTDGIEQFRFVLSY